MTKRSDGIADADHTPETSAPDAITPVDDTRATAPATVPGPESDDTGRRRGKDADRTPGSSGGMLGSAWVGLVLGALVTILLLVFIVQNLDSAEVHYFGWTFMLPLGVLVLFAAIAGALIMAMFAGFRILQLRMRAHKARRLASRGR